MKRILLFPVSIALFLGLFIFSSPVLAFQPSLYVINFGGGVGHAYSPNFITVEVGDTIVWNGDFSTYPLISTSIPADASPLGPVTSGTSYTYIIQAAGTYSYKNPTWAPLGMTGIISAVFKPHGSLTNAGREFYLGLIYPTYNYIAPSALIRQYQVYALISTFYDNVVNVTYYDAGGNELTPKVYNVPAHSRLQILLDAQALRLDSTVETAAYKACHIISKYPITVQYLSHGGNAGGAYLALPTLTAGKKYVVASYNDDATNGALSQDKKNGIPAPDIAGGTFMIIATDNVTAVNITTTTPTSTGKSGTFGATLNKGQCYLVRSDGKNSDHDLSGTIIESSKPIIVLSGHEDAYIGDGSNITAEQRNSLIEQMIPYEYWDSVGYIGIPFTNTGNPSSTTGGIGDAYRVFTHDPGVAKVQADVGGIAGGYDMSTSPLNYSNKIDITSPVDIYSTNGHKISVMQYDERSEGRQNPYPSPSMMTIVPHSRWRTNYNFSEFDPAGIAGVNTNQYVGVIADSLQTIKVSIDGGPDGPISTLGSSLGSYYSVSNRYKNGPITGGRYEVASHTFYLHSDYPFICYTYGMGQINLGFWGGNYEYDYEYSAPAGMQLNTGVPPSFKISVDEHSDCSGWHICVVDTGTNNPGIKAVMLVDDTAGVYFNRPGVKFRNVSFDSTSGDFNRGELHPNLQTNQSYCFDVRIDNHLSQARAPIGLIDNNGNGLLIQLQHSAPTYQLATTPIISPKPDSVFFPTGKVGNQICTTFVVHNTAPAGGSALSFNAATFKKADPVYSISSTTPTLPASIAAGDSLTIQVCYTSKDLLRHQDTLLIATGCFSIPISLDAHSSTGLISATDISFGNVKVGTQLCKTLVIQNTGSDQFTLMASPVLSDNVNFTIDPVFLANLPKIMPPGFKVTVNVCFDPQKPTADSARISWVTDIAAEFANSGKNYSTLLGAGLDTAAGSVNSESAIPNSLSVRPNPAIGNSALVSFALPGKNRVEIAIFDLLGRQIFSRNIGQGAGEFELPIGKFSNGVYQVRLTSDDVVLTQKLEVAR